MEKASEKKRGLGGQITVFVSMILMLLFAFLCVLMESARTAGARWYLQMAASSSMDSVFSQYHRQLWDRYRLLFAEYETGAEMEADFAGFLLPYLETDNWYPMALEAVSAEEIVRAVDGHGAYLEKEILDYMKYGIWNLDFEGDAVENLWKQEREAEAVTEMAQIYRTRTRDVWKLERVLESISENLNRQRNERQQGLNALSSYDGAGFRRAAEQMIGALKKMPGLVKQYEKEADRLAETLQADRREQEARTDRLGTDMAAALEQEIQEYEAYVAEDGKRRQEIRDLEPRSAEQIQRLEEPYGEGAGSGSMPDHVLVNEYCGMFFSQFCSAQENGESGTQKQSAGSGNGLQTPAGVPESGNQDHTLDYEVEYLLYGNGSDRENLSDAVHRLLAVRSGLNLIHILSDNAKRAQARELAAVITGAGSITPLILVTTFFVMSVWALGEALMDVKGLLAGRKVMLLKAAEDWTLSVENLLALGRDGKPDTGGGERGLSYLSWLKILLFVEPLVRQEYRIMDVIELNLGQGNSGFRMRNGVYQVDMSGRVCGKHLFFSPAFVENITGNHDQGMMMTVKTERRY